MKYLVVPPIKLGVFLFLLFILNACSSIKTLFQSVPYQKEKQIRDIDYVEQINYLGNEYLSSQKKKTIRLKKSTRSYLNDLILNIYNANTQYLGKKVPKIKFYFVKHTSPFYFSLPDGSMVISSILIEKYIDNESLLAVVLTKLLYVSMNNLYMKQLAVPRGGVDLIEILKLCDLSLEAKSEVNKWTYQLMYRSGFDGSANLNWIQLKNKNILNFSLMYKDLNIISREEYSFKQFLVLKPKLDRFSLERNSSRKFYLFRKDVLKNARIISI